MEKRTNVVLEEELVEKAKKLTGIKTTRELMHYALREVVRRKRQKEIRKLRGRIRWEGDLTEMRRGRTL